MATKRLNPFSLLLVAGLAASLLTLACLRSRSVKLDVGSPATTGATTKPPKFLLAGADSNVCGQCQAGNLEPSARCGMTEIGCLVCHESDGQGGNLSSVAARINFADFGLAEVSFTDNTVGVGKGGFVDPDPSVKGICEACHSYPSDDLTLDPPHRLEQSMGACTECHLHHNGFNPGLAVFARDEYVGAEACAKCHTERHETWAKTIHATSLESLAPSELSDPDCLRCHTMGFDEPGGNHLTAEGTLTRQDLKGVQCESCHGPSSGHSGNSLGVEALVDRSAAMCGECHTESDQPTFDEWLTSTHANSSLNADDESCAACHAPLAAVEGQVIGEGHTLLNVECVVCHDPHAQTGNDALPDPDGFHDFQLRNPEVRFLPLEPSYSAKDAADSNRFSQCGQCHRSLGLTWATAVADPPHAVQSNVYFGEMPVPDGEPALVEATTSTHQVAELQCVTCHMYTAWPEDGPPKLAAIKGHSYEINTQACAPCHVPGFEVEPLYVGLRAEIQEGLDMIAGRLGDPATWEYIINGGPDAAGQALIPDEIKKVRFMYHYIIGDGSLGVHNPFYVRTIITEAEFILDGMEE